MGYLKCVCGILIAFNVLCLLFLHDFKITLYFFALGEAYFFNYLSEQ